MVQEKNIAQELAEKFIQFYNFTPVFFDQSYIQPTQQTKILSTFFHIIDDYLPTNPSMLPPKTAFGKNKEYLAILDNLIEQLTKITNEAETTQLHTNTSKLLCGAMEELKKLLPKEKLQRLEEERVLPLSQEGKILYTTKNTQMVNEDFGLKLWVTLQEEKNNTANCLYSFLLSSSHSSSSVLSTASDSERKTPTNQMK